MSLSLPNTSKSHGTTIGLSLMMSASWCHAPRGSSKDIGIFIGSGLSTSCDYYYMEKTI